MYKTGPKCTQIMQWIFIKIIDSEEDLGQDSGPASSEAHLLSYSMDSGRSSPGRKVHCWPPSSAQVKNEQSYTSTPPNMPSSVHTGMYPLLVYWQCANYEALTALKDISEYTELNMNGEKSVAVYLKSGLHVINEVTSQWGIKSS
jgi:hypothetical protein